MPSLAADATAPLPRLSAPRTTPFPSYFLLYLFIYVALSLNILTLAYCQASSMPEMCFFGSASFAKGLILLPKDLVLRLQEG